MQMFIRLKYSLTRVIWEAGGASISSIVMMSYNKWSNYSLTTAVQDKNWADRRHVGSDVIRELHSARLNTKPTYLYDMLVTSSDISPQARKEAQDRHIEYWHGVALEYRLEKWDKWQGKQSRRRRTGSIGEMSHFTLRLYHETTNHTVLFPWWSVVHLSRGLQPPAKNLLDFLSAVPHRP
jgi:hypothetical protein